MNGGDLVDRGVIWLYTVEGVLMFQSNKLYLKSRFRGDCKCKPQNVWNF